jgi:hypothetical protein
MLSQHRLAGTRRTDHQNVVTAGAGNLQGALGRVLAADILEVHEEPLRFAEQGFAVHFKRQDSVYEGKPRESGSLSGGTPAA